jgi:hypothetical protein
MKAAPFVVILVIAAVSVSAQPGAGTITVPIVRLEQAALKQACEQNPTTIVVIGNQAYHCIAKKLVGHSEKPALDAAVVRLKVGQRIQWQAQGDFSVRVVRVERHGTLVPGTPNDPFSGNPFPDKGAKEVLSGTVVDLDGDHEQRYKATFMIDNVLVDPDFVCQM